MDSDALANELQKLHSAYARLAEENTALRSSAELQVAGLRSENEQLRHKLSVKLAAAQKEKAQPAAPLQPPPPPMSQPPRHALVSSTTNPPPQEGRELRKLRAENLALDKDLQKAHAALRRSEADARDLRIESQQESALGELVIHILVPLIT